MPNVKVWHTGVVDGTESTPLLIVEIQIWTWAHTDRNPNPDANETHTEPRLDQKIENAYVRAHTQPREHSEKPGKRLSPEISQPSLAGNLHTNSMVRGFLPNGLHDMQSRRYSPIGAFQIHG
uniref:Uncharacterized protein n=1 Tax=Eutreptiella gymnastica TaxID=73025 RepID=A0A7S1NKE7_9EUGL